MWPPALAFSASALDLDGIVARVEFFANRVKVGEATSGLSFAFTWSNPPAGDWLLTAVATDDIGAKTASLGVPITIVGTPTTLLATGSLWKYLDTGANLGSGWRSNAFNDATWASGPAPLGYGEINVGGWPATTNSYGPDANTKYITTYYRRTFTSPDPTNYAQLLFRLQRDDGAVVYLNGAEIFRSNMPTGVVNYLTLAASGVGGIDEVTFFPTVVSPAFLRAGVNLLAVEIHQVLPTSSDIIFDLELKAYPPSALPRLSAAGNSGPLTLAWPGWATNCTLQFATNLAPPVTWSSVTNTPVPTNGQWVLPLFRATNAQQFYRLQTS